jgi:hypothetical protein
VPRPTRSASGSDPLVAFRSLTMRNAQCEGWRQRQQAACPSGARSTSRPRGQGQTACPRVRRSGADHSCLDELWAIVEDGTPTHLRSLNAAPMT